MFDIIPYNYLIYILLIVYIVHYYIIIFYYCTLQYKQTSHIKRITFKIQSSDCAYISIYSINSLYIGLSSRATKGKYVKTVKTWKCSFLGNCLEQMTKFSSPRSLVYKYYSFNILYVGLLFRLQKVEMLKYGCTIFSAPN